MTGTPSSCLLIFLKYITVIHCKTERIWNILWNSWIAVLGVLRQIREVWCIPNLIFVVSNTQSIFSFTFFVCAPTHNAEALFYVSHSCSECLKMSNTCFLWPVFSKLGWGIRKLRTCYEILCVGKMIGIEADETPNGVSWRELLGGLSVLPKEILSPCLLQCAAK